MRFRLALATAAVLMVSPSFAMDVAGFYAGFYVGHAARGDAIFDFDQAAGIVTTGGTVEQPSSIVNDGIDPVLFDFLNAGLSHYSFVDFAQGAGLLTQGTLNFGPGEIGGVVLGIALGNGWRLEGDLSATGFAALDYTPQTGTLAAADGLMDPSGVFTWSDAGSAPLPPPAPPPTPLSDFDLALQTDVQFLLVNAFYDIDTGSPLSPYVGAGVGLARVTSTLTDSCGCGATHVETASTIVPAAQLGGGVRVALADPVTLDIGYRYKLAASPDLEVMDLQDAGGLFGFFATKQSGPISVQTVTAGLTFALK